MARSFLVSSDCSGIAGDIYLVKRLWGSVLQDPHCRGVELIGWTWTPALMRQAKKCHIHVSGIHGRTGGFREEKQTMGRVVMGSLNEIFLTHKKLVDLSSRVDYILLHRSALSPSLIDLIAQNKHKINRLYIENVIAPDDVERTIETVHFLKEREIPAGMMFDLVHFLRQPYFDSPRMARFDGLIHTMHEVAKKKIELSIHLPIGSYTRDSLPFSKISTSMWRQLSHAIEDLNPRYVVLENQQQRAYSLYLPRWKYKEVEYRNQWVVNFLKEKDIL